MLKICNMKKIFLFTVLLLNAVVYAQDDVLKKVARETCECIEEKKSKSGDLAGDDLTSTLGICMVKSYSDHVSEFKNKVEFTDKDGMTNLGKEVGVKMLEFCPNVILELGKQDKGDADAEEEDIYVSGEVIDIKIEQFVTLQIKDQKGRNYTFLLLDYFDTASLLTNNEVKKKDKLNVGYTEIELFDTKTKEFRAYKILRKLEKL